MTPRRRTIGVAAGIASTLLLGALAEGLSSAPIPVPGPYTGDWPRATPPPGMSVHRLPTGVTHRSAGFAHRGGSLFDGRDFAMTALLVEHPDGDLLVDTGLGAAIAQQLERMPFWFRAITDYQRSSSAAERLDAIGYDRSRLRAILPTHAHWDHVSGIPELAGTPVWVTAEERRFIAQGGWITSIARSFESARWEILGFESGPVLGFPRSHDVYGDGSVLVVPAPGHTPGSVMVFLTLPDGARHALLGDLVWQLEGITRREERPWLQRRLADVDEEEVRRGIAHVAALAARFPELNLVPAHDARGFAAIPALRAKR